MEDPEANTVAVEPQEPDWKAEYEKAKPILERHESLEKQYKNLQRELNKARTEHVLKSDIASLEDRLAKALDAMSPADDDEPPRKQRPSEILRRPAETKPETPPDQVVDAKRALKLMDRLGLSDADKARIQDEYEPADAVEKLEKDLEAKIRKEAAEEAINKLREEHKASGATKGDGGPSASADDDASFLERFNRGELNSKADIERAKRMIGL